MEGNGCRKMGATGPGMGAVMTGEREGGEESEGN